MQATKHAAALGFHGSISRRLTILSALFLILVILILVILVGGLSVLKGRHIGALHDESEELDSHVQLLARLESALFHLRAETQDALFVASNPPIQPAWGRG